MIALLHAVLVAMATIFSSRVTSTTAEVLVKLSKCGLAVFSPFNSLTLTEADMPAENALYVIAQMTIERSLAYTTTCYRNASSTVYTCNEFVRRHLESTANATEECPFSDIVYITPALSVDTGYLDSDFHLGINALVSDRISFRKKLTCASVNADNYTLGWTTECMAPISHGIQT